MKHDVYMCNISMEWKMCRIHGGIKTTILHNLINHNTTLSDPWLKALEQTYFQTCWKLSESKTLKTIYVKYQLRSE